MENDDIIIEEENEESQNKNGENKNFSFVEGMFDTVFKNFYGADSLDSDYIRNSFEAIKNRYRDENGNMDISKIVSEAQSMGVNEETMQKAREMASNMMNKNNSNNQEENNDVIVED